MDVIFAPRAREMYPEGYQSYVDVERLTTHLCGASRPGHFRGVTTVVTKLFNIVKPHVAFFGRKDYQQLAVIRRMTADLNMEVEVVGMPIVREADGLALSSRNSYLRPADRASALSISRGLRRAEALHAGGERNAEALRMVVENEMREAGLAVDYAAVVDAATLEPLTALGERPALLAVAARVGGTRLIDNTLLQER